MKVYTTKKDAAKAATKFLKEVSMIEEKYGFSFNSDTGDIYLSFRNQNKDVSLWDTISLGWDGDGSGIKVTEKIKDKNYYRQKALNKLSKKEREALNLK